MAYNTKKILRDRNGDPIPQSYDSGSDRYVPSEIDTRLKAIENQQQEILKRLDKPIDTQVTGSIVEKVLVDKADFSPGNRTQIWAASDSSKLLENYTEYALSIKTGDRDSDFTIDIDYRSLSDEFGSAYRDSDRYDGKSVYTEITEFKTLKIPAVIMYLTNNKSESGDFSVSIILKK